jgi:hypothetical protein
MIDSQHTQRAIDRRLRRQDFDDLIMHNRTQGKVDDEMVLSVASVSYGE